MSAEDPERPVIAGGGRVLVAAGRDTGRVARLVDCAVNLIAGDLPTGGRQAPRSKVGSAPPVASVLTAACLIGDRASGLLDRLAGDLARAPILLAPSGSATAAAGELSAALAALGGRSAVFGEPRPARVYRFARDRALGPFAEAVLSECGARPVSCALIGPAAGRPLITTDHGAALLELEDPTRTVLVSCAPVGQPADRAASGPRFDGRDFMGVLPLLVFLRASLGAQVWHNPRPRAAFLIDDPNLRARRYGWVDYARLVADGERHRFHTAMAMIPLDHGKTREPAASLFRAHPERLSLVVHGVDHVHHEFARPVDDAEADAILTEGLRRVGAHERDWNLPWDRVMTFPFGRTTSTWLNAMHRVGFDAGIVSCIAPPLPAEILRDPPYHLYPADLDRQSLPVLTRQPLENPRDDLLFEAFLGKPIIITMHHDALRGGTEKLIEIADYVNRHIDPEWGSVGGIVQANYQWRVDPSGLSLRVFSNRVTVPPAAGHRLAAVLKPCPGAPVNERARANGEPVALEPVAGVGLLARNVRLPPGVPLELTFGSVPAPRPPPPAARRHWPSSARRLVTETRDQALGARVSGRLMRLALERPAQDSPRGSESPDPEHSQHPAA